MGYACPVCEAPQADDEHLANHLAFSALLGREDHERWLDEHAPDWDQSDPESLAAAVVEHVEETEYPQVFDEGVEERHVDRTVQSPPGGPTIGGDDPDVQAILDEAREMTERMRDADENE